MYMRLTKKIFEQLTKIRIVLLLLKVNLLFSFQANCQDLDWINTISGPGMNGVLSTEIDNNGDIYFSGYFSGTIDFDPGPGVENRTSAGGRDAFLLKLSAIGEFEWVIALGGTSNDNGSHIATDNQMNVYFVFDYYDMTDVDPTLNTNLSGSTGTRDIGIMKLNQAGDYVWHKIIAGPNDNEHIRFITINNDQLYVAGSFNDSVDFAVTGNSYVMNSNGFRDCFLLKLDLNGDFVWAKSIGGIGNDNFHEVDHDINGNIYIACTFQETVDFDPGPGAMNITSNGLEDGAILKLSPNGDFIWAKRIGGIYGDMVEAIKIDKNSNLFVGGEFSNTVDLDPGVGISNATSAGASDMFILKMDTAGNLVWYEQIGSTMDDRVRDIEISENGEIYCAGHFSNTVDFDLSSANNSLTSNGGMDHFILKMDSLKNFIWAGSMGGSTSLSFIDLELAKCNSGILVCGGYFSTDTDLDPTNSISTYSSQDYDGYMVSLSFPIIVQIENNDNILSTSNSAAHYQWLDCNNNYEAIPGENSPFMVASQNGAYALEITHLNGCKDTSECLIVTDVSLGENSLSIEVFPVPADESIQITSSKRIEEFWIFDYSGRLLKYDQIGEKQFNIFTDELQNGVFLLQLKFGNSFYQEKIIVSH